MKIGVGLVCSVRLKQTAGALKVAIGDGLWAARFRLIVEHADIAAVDIAKTAKLSPNTQLNIAEYDLKIFIEASELIKLCAVNGHAGPRQRGDWTCDRRRNEARFAPANSRAGLLVEMVGPARNTDHHTGMLNSLVGVQKHGANTSDAVSCGKAKQLLKPISR